MRTIFDLRPTCKRFCSLLSSPSFLSLLHTTSRSFLLLSHPQFSHRLLPFYSHSTASWRSYSPRQPSRLLSVSSGLLLFSPISSPSTFLLFNPITRSSRRLDSPVPSPPSATIISFVSSYKILVPFQDSNWVFLYDSSTGSWNPFPIPPNSNIQEPTFFNGSLYFITQEPFTIKNVELMKGDGFFPGDVGSDLPVGLTFARLVGDGERRLFLVGGIGIDDGITRSVVVWEMAAGRWEEVGSLPEMMCKKLVSVCYHNYCHVQCVWYDGLLCICCMTWPEVLSLKVERGTWHWLPRCPLLHDKWSCGFRWFSFVPNLCATV